MDPLFAPFHGVRWRSADAAVPPLGGGPGDLGTAEARELAWCASQRPWLDDAAWEACVQSVRAAARLRRDGRVLGSLRARLRAMPLAARVSVDDAVARPLGGTWGVAVVDATEDGAGRRADPHLSALYDATVLDSARRHVAALEAALCDLGGLDATQQLASVGREMESVREACAVALSRALLGLAGADLAADLARLRARVLPDHVGAVRRAMNDTLAMLRRVGRLAAAAQHDDAFDDTVVEQYNDPLAALVATPPLDVEAALAQSGAHLCALRWVLLPPPAESTWLAPSLAVRMRAVRSWVEEHADALAWACSSAIHALRTVQQLPDDAPEFVGVAWAPAASTDGVAAPPLPHLAAARAADTAAARRLVEVRERSQPAVGVRAARLLHALALEHQAGLLPPRCASVAALLPIVERLVVETELHCVRYAAHLWQTVGATEAAAFPLDDFQEAAEAWRRGAPAPLPVPLLAPAAAAPPVAASAPARPAAPSAARADYNTIPLHLRRAHAVLCALHACFQPHAASPLPPTQPTVFVTVERVAQAARARAPDVFPGTDAAVGRLIANDLKRAMRIALSDPSVTSAPSPSEGAVVWRRRGGAAAAHLRSCGVEATAYGVHALMATATSLVQAMEAHPSEAEAQWCASKEDVHRLRSRERQRLAAAAST